MKLYDFLELTKTGKQKEEEKKTPAGLAALAGGGTLGVAAGLTSLSDLYKNLKEESIVKKNILPKLKKGDIIIQSGVGESGNLPYKGLRNLTFGHAIETVSGSPDYHTGMYIGKGKVMDTTGMSGSNLKGGVNIQSLKKFIKNSKNKIYRVKELSDKDIKHRDKVINFFKKNKVEYPKVKQEMADFLINNLLFHKDKANKELRKKTPEACTGLITKAFPKHFKGRRFVLPSDIRNYKNIELLGGIDKLKEKPKLLEKILYYGVSPVARNLKYAIPAATLAYFGKKIYDEKQQKN